VGGKNGEGAGGLQCFEAGQDVESRGSGEPRGSQEEKVANWPIMGLLGALQGRRKQEKKLRNGAFQENKQKRGGGST